MTKLDELLAASLISTPVSSLGSTRESQGWHQMLTNDVRCPISGEPTSSFLRPIASCLGTFEAPASSHCKASHSSACLAVSSKRQRIRVGPMLYSKLWINRLCSSHWLVFIYTLIHNLLIIVISLMTFFFVLWFISERYWVLYLNFTLVH